MGQINPTLPVAGSTLNSVADPELVTALQTIITLLNGNIDPSNLSTTSGVMHLALRTTSSSIAANIGDLVLATSGTTITLPAPAPNALVAVQAQSTVTGASPVTVSGTNIYGVGLGPVSSFVLGTGQSCAILQSDGANWSIIAGQRDTGWVPLTLATNWGAGSGYASSARLQGDTVRLKGRPVNNTGGTIGRGNSVATVPAGLRPGATVTCPAFPSQLSGTPSAACYVDVASSGAITFQSDGFLVNTALLDLGSVIYPLS